MYQRRSRSTRWLIRRPGHLLAFWLSLSLFSLVGILLVALVLPIYYLPAFIVTTWLSLGLDLRYMPRAFRAWRKQDAGTGQPAPLDSL